MSAPPSEMPFLAAWLEAQQALAQLALAGSVTDPAAKAVQQLFADQYRHVFTLPGPLPAAASAMAAGATLTRYRQAAERCSQLLGEAATDAARRLGEALAQSGPDAPPITTWRELLALWIDCGEAAWSAAAHREDFAQAQAELLAALVALRAAGRAT